MIKKEAPLFWGSFSRLNLYFCDNNFIEFQPISFFGLESTNLFEYGKICE